LFEQFKENLSLMRETPREGLRSAQLAWRRATPTKRAIWLGVPVVIVANSVADHFSVPWYYKVAVLVFAPLGSWIQGAMRRKLQ
jgi:hypothetical protein